MLGPVTDYIAGVFTHSTLPVFSLRSTEQQSGVFAIKYVWAQSTFEFKGFVVSLSLCAFTLTIHLLFLLS